MMTDDAAQRLLEAETKLAQAVHRLRTLQAAAFDGSYDAAEFDRAVMAYRDARSGVAEARAVLARRQQAHAEPEEQAERRAAPPSARLLFARWLVQSGRLSEWNVA